MSNIKVVVNGILGRMGQQVLEALCVEPDLTPAGGADLLSKSNAITLPDGSGTLKVSRSIADAASDADVVIDFTNAEGALSVIRVASAMKVNVVIGSTGLSKDTYDEAEKLAYEHDIGIIIAPNFAVGAVLMTHLSKIAARFFDYADLTETHHESKIDSPSGTSLAIAKAIVEGKDGSFKSPVAHKEILSKTRGGVLNGVNIHSVRMPGRVAHHELVFGTIGQTLSIRHDSINRESFMPGVMMAAREATKLKGLTVGLEKIMGL